MQVAMVNLLDSQLPDSFLWTSMFFLMTVASSSDPCPPASKLSPCWCADFPLYWSRTTETIMTTTTPQPSSTPQDVSTTQTTGTSWLTSSTQSVTERRKKRRHVKRQSDTFSAFSRDAYYTEVSCNFTDTVHQLEEGIGKGLERRWVDKVTISNHRPDAEGDHVRLPNRLFRKTRLKQFKITQTLLAGDFIHSGDPFDGQAHSLMWFSANYCFLRGQLTYSDAGTIHTMGLNKLIRLQGLDLSNNELEYVHDSAFRSPPANLTTLRLSNNKIRGLGIWVFQKMPRLRLLDLSFNQLETVRKTMFPPSVININLSWNHITTLPNDFFTTMPALRIFNLSYNFLYSLPEKTWASKWRQFHVIDVTGNYFPCDCSLMWLTSDMPSEGNGTSTVSLLQERSVLGSCSAFRPDSYPENYPLANLTRSSLDC